MVELILGGARSGKSSLAQSVAFGSAGNDVVYIATATEIDAEMSDRIAKHKQDRPQDWVLIEEPLKLCEVIKEYGPSHTLLVDCLTLWLNNHLYNQPTQDFSKLYSNLIDASKIAKHVIFVANEVGLGVTPLGEISRRFVDEAGRLNQQLAARADKVTFVVAGLPQVLKGRDL
jgi:adenosylcobinamide kinase/adenosylcobinamide-phosphate guanylyltransferase